MISEVPLIDTDVLLLPFVIYEDRFQPHYNKLLNGDYSPLKRNNDNICIVHLTSDVIIKILDKNFKTICNANNINKASFSEESKKMQDYKKDNKGGINYSFIEILHYMCIQLFRTPRIFNISKQCGIEKNLSEEITRYYTILMIHIDSINLCNNLFRENYKFTVLKNESNINFITCDNPVMNLLNENDDKVKLFFPLSSTIALLLTNEINNGEYKENIINDSEVVQKYNNLIKNNSERFYYS